MALILNNGSLDEYKIKPKTKNHTKVTPLSGFNGRLDVGSIFRTTNSHGSIDLGSSSPSYEHFHITGVNNFIPQGTFTNKVGERTGWTQGNVSAICKNISVGNKTLVCQNEVQATADHGDSGAPVFEDIQGSSDPYDATFDGILWGGTTRNGKEYYWYSSVTRVKNELSGPNVHDLQFTWLSH